MSRNSHYKPVQRSFEKKKASDSQHRTHVNSIWSDMWIRHRNKPAQNQICLLCRLSEFFFDFWSDKLWRTIRSHVTPSKNAVGAYCGAVTNDFYLFLDLFSNLFMFSLKLAWNKQEESGWVRRASDVAMKNLRRSSNPKVSFCKLSTLLWSRFSDHRWH